MLKINLLPSYIYEKRKMRQTMVLFIVLVLGVAGGMFGWITMLNKQKAQLESDVMAMETKMNEVKGIEALAVAEEAKAPPMKNKVDFIQGIMAYNTEYPKLYEELARYTYSRILYKSIEPSGGNQLRISARARSVGDCGRYLLNLYRATHIFSGITIDGVPTWSGSVPDAFDFSVTCNLVKPIAAPNYAGSTTPQ